MPTTLSDKESEWLQLLEFVRRKQGEATAEYIKRKYYDSRGDKTVSDHIYGQLGKPLIQLLREPNFLNEVLRTNTSNVAIGEDVNRFTDIYNKTDDLMNSLGNLEDDIYIKCMAVDETTGIEITPTNNNIGTGTSSLNAMLSEMGRLIDPMMLYSNVGLQTFISILFFAIIYYMGKYMFLDYPKNIISKRI